MQALFRVLRLVKASCVRNWKSYIWSSLQLLGILCYHKVPQYDHHYYTKATFNYHFQQTNLSILEKEFVGRGKGLSLSSMDARYPQNRLPLSSLLVSTPTIAKVPSSPKPGPIPKHTFPKPNFFITGTLPQHSKYRLCQRLLSFLLPASTMSLHHSLKQLPGLLPGFFTKQHQLAFKFDFQ